MVTVQVGVGDRVEANQLRAIASANQSYTALIEPNITLLTTSLTDKLTDILCNSWHSPHCVLFCN